MLKIEELLCLTEKFAPLSLSYKMIERGDYDNSGLIIKTHDEVKAVLFSLDLTEAAVKRAKTLKCDAIITHHPAVYAPIKSLSEEDRETAPVIAAIKADINVISMHLNLDVAEGGIDDCLFKALSGREYKILDYIDDVHGYGREFIIDKTLSEIKREIKSKLKTDKVVVYGRGRDKIKKAASFCGGGSSSALKAVKEKKTDADLIITSDMPHHVIKELTEYRKSIIILPHYVAEEYGFKEFYVKVARETEKKVEAYYFADKRFF